MFILLAIVGVLLVVAGLLGCILPVLPGPPLSILGLLALWAGRGFEAHTFGAGLFIALLAAVVVVTVLDYLVPLWGAKRYGASKAGVWGAAIGMIAGIFFFPPFGMLVGTFLGAAAGELAAGREGGAAGRAAWGVFVGTMAGIVLKLACSGVVTWYFFVELLSGEGG